MLLILGGVVSGKTVGAFSPSESPDFVKASLLVMSPGDELYSCVGHAAFRMECPTHNLDFCFSYESEGVRDRVLTFLRGKLKMGMFAVPSAEYIELYSKEGRAVVQYGLNLPLADKKKLWQILDEEVAKGAEQQYDAINRGCAMSMLNFLNASTGGRIKSGQYKDKFDGTVREIFNDAVAGSPWNRFVLNIIVGTDVDRNVPKRDKIVIPADLCDYLHNATLGKTHVITEDGRELTGKGKVSESTSFMTSPMAVSIVLCAASVAFVFFKCKYFDWLLLLIQTGIGLLLVYLIVFSSLPATDWNWLIIPFNPLPAVFWKWRKYWKKWFACGVLIWECFMLFWPHQLTDPAFLVIAFAIAITAGKQYMKILPKSFAVLPPLPASYARKR